MKQLFIILFISFVLTSVAVTADAQSKLGYVSTQELVVAMPEYKKADTSLAEYQTALNQQYAEMVKEFNQQDSLLTGKDTVKYTKAQLEIKRQSLNQLYVKIQGWNQQAQQMYQAKEEELLKPVYDKARKAIQDVAKENGYTYVFNKEQLLVFPQADDMLPSVKKKLNLK